MVAVGFIVHICRRMSPWDNFKCHLLFQFVTILVDPDGASLLDRHGMPSLILLLRKPFVALFFFSFFLKSS